MKQCPEVPVPFQYYMSATATITSVWPAHCSEFISHKMLIACTPMSAAAEYSYLVYKIAFFQNRTFTISQIYLNINQSIMKYALLLLVFPALMAGDCGNKKDKNGDSVNPKEDTSAVPACVKKLLDDAAKDTPPTLPIQIDEYSYKGKRVYLVTADCCDFYNVVYDENCGRICAPSGGIAGTGDGQCPDFSKEAKHVRLVWKKDK